MAPGVILRRWSKNRLKSIQSKKLKCAPDTLKTGPKIYKV